MVLLLMCPSAHAVAAAASDSKTSASKTTTSTSTAPGAQAFKTDSPLQIGTIVAIDSKDGSKVVPATQKNLNSMYGITVDQNQQTITIVSPTTGNQAYVASAGHFKTLVTNQNGAIKAGDYITLSAIDGVGMKADAGQKIVFGKALENFDGKTNAIGSTQLKDVNGKATGTVGIGMILVDINIKQNPIEKSTKANLPPLLQRIGQAIAEKPVGPFRIYLSIVITGISIFVAMVLLYGGVRNSLISIGRNPLSKKSIFRGLLEIVLTSIIILIIGLFAVYLLLKL